MTENVKHEENEWHIQTQMPPCQKQLYKMGTEQERQGKRHVGKAEKSPGTDNLTVWKPQRSEIIFVVFFPPAQSKLLNNFYLYLMNVNFTPIIPFRSKYTNFNKLLIAFSALTFSFSQTQAPNLEEIVCCSFRSISNGKWQQRQPWKRMMLIA